MSLSGDQKWCLSTTATWKKLPVHCTGTYCHTRKALVMTFFKHYDKVKVFSFSKILQKDNIFKARILLLLRFTFERKLGQTFNFYCQGYILLGFNRARLWQEVCQQGHTYSPRSETKLAVQVEHGQQSQKSVQGQAVLVNPRILFNRSFS